MKKPVITISNGCLETKFDLSEPFNDSDMVEKYNNMQALIDMVFKDGEQESELEGNLGSAED